MSPGLSLLTVDARVCLYLSGRLAARELVFTLDGPDGVDKDEVTLEVGDNRTLECDMHPWGLGSSLDAQWTAFVDGASAHIVSVNVTNGRALIVPPSGLGRYASAGEVDVRCVLSTREGEPIVQFNRTVKVLGESERYVVRQALFVKLSAGTIGAFGNTDDLASRVCLHTPACKRACVRACVRM